MATHWIPPVPSCCLWAMSVPEKLPVIREQAVAEDKPSPLVTFQVVGPFKEPSFVSV